MMARNVIILLGYPGAGKGTQAKEIMRRLSIPQISTGDMLREEIARCSDAGKHARDLMAAGRFVEDFVVDLIVADRIRREDCLGGFILDGYPRTVSQAGTFSRELSSADRLSVIEIAADPEHVLSRLLGRRMCPACTAIYHVQSKPPKQDGVCDTCGAMLVQRPDDVKEKIEERFLHYREKTDPLIAYYEQTGCFVRVDGRPPAEQVALEVMSIIDRYAVEVAAAAKAEKGSLA